MLVPSTPETNSDGADFYQSCQKKTFSHSHEQIDIQSQNLFGHEFISMNGMSQQEYESIPGGFVYAPHSNVPAQVLTYQIRDNDNSYPAQPNFGNMQANNHHQMIQSDMDPGTGLPRRICSNCGSISTPSWRRCPEGRNLLCNACGLYQKLHKRPRPLMIREDGSVQVIRSINSSGMNICQNCKTTETPIWRRSPDGKNQMLCNACALYLKNHNSSRPSDFNFNEDDLNLLT